MIAQRIRQARLARGLSQSELAEAAGGISKQAISYYEAGDDVPRSSVLMRLAEALNVQLDYFFRSVTIELGEPAYRKHCKLTKSAMAKLESRVQDEVERYVETESLFDPNSVKAFKRPPGFSRAIQEPEDVECLGVKLRQHWLVGMDPIDNLTELLEDQAVKVIYVDEDEHFDGCAYPNGNVPVIVVNHDKPGDRLRFNLAHELGHLLLKFLEEWDDKQIERAARRFAGAFLVPKDVACRELGRDRVRISTLELMELKRKYGMSMQAWIMRAKQLGIITEYAYEKLWREFGARGWRKNEPVKYKKEESTRHKRLVARAYESDMISESRAAELLAVPREEVVDLLALNGSDSYESSHS